MADYILENIRKDIEITPDILKDINLGNIECCPSCKYYFMCYFIDMTCDYCKTICCQGCAMLTNRNDKHTICINCVKNNKNDINELNTNIQAMNDFNNEFAIVFPQFLEN